MVYSVRAVGSGGQRISGWPFTVTESVGRGAVRIAGAAAAFFGTTAMAPCPWLAAARARNRLEPSRVEKSGHGMPVVCEPSSPSDRAERSWRAVNGYADA